MKLVNLGSNKNLLKFSDGSEVFFSYQTPVASYSPNEGYKRTRTHWSVTTSRHINTYLKDVEAESVDQADIDALVADFKPLVA